MAILNNNQNVSDIILTTAALFMQLLSFTKIIAIVIIILILCVEL